MKWIKASVRLPDNAGRENEVVVRGNIKDLKDYDSEFANRLPSNFVTFGFKNYGTPAQLYFSIGNRTYLSNDVEWLDESPESPSQSLQEAAEAYAVGEVGEGSNNVNDPFHPQYKMLNDAWVAGWNAREAQGPPTISKTETLQEAAAKCASRKYVECGGSILAMIECFKEGTVWQAQQTGPILTRELHDTIWEAAQDRLAYDTADGKPFSYAPDKETFYKSLNL